MKTNRNRNEKNLFNVNKLSIVWFLKNKIM